MARFPQGESIDLAKVAQYYDVVSGRDALNEVLREIFDNNYCLTKLHTFLARIPVPLLIVTTNYDDCIKRAFEAEGRPYDLVAHTTDIAMGDQLLWYQHGETEPQIVIPNKFVIDLKTRTVIYKMQRAFRLFSITIYGSNIWIVKRRGKPLSSRSTSTTRCTRLTARRK
jgi:hypothetical protein